MNDAEIEIEIHTFGGANLLQCDRAMNDAEMAGFFVAGVGVAVLQCDRAMNDAEIEFILRHV